MKRQFNEFLNILKLSPFALFLAVGAGWVGDSLAEMLSPHLAKMPVPGSPQSALLLLGIAAFIAGAVGLYHLRGTLLPVRVLSQTDRVPRKNVLILLVSPPNFSFDDGFQTVSQTISRDSQSIKLSHNLKEDIQTSGIAWNWQQILRAIRPHLPKLETVWLLGSSGNRGSFSALDTCERFLRVYPEIQQCTIRLYPDALDFEDIEALYEAFTRILKEEKHQGRDEKDVVIDATGGPKTASIAVALFTTHHPELTFQYVTNDGTLRNFNVITRQPGDIG